MKKLRTISLLMAALISTQTFACGEITPNKNITKLVTRLAYQDFPKASDIFSIIRIESRYIPKAVNINEREHSNGLMQVQNGPMNPRLNIVMGVSLLRKYYKITGSEEGAVKSYNIGPGNYLKGKIKVSGQEYYDKFLLQKIVYERYPKGEIVKLGKTLGCGKENNINFTPENKAKLSRKHTYKKIKILKHKKK
jgi:hypothetical protein